MRRSALKFAKARSQMDAENLHSVTAAKETFLLYTFDGLAVIIGSFHSRDRGEIVPESDYLRVPSIPQHDCTFEPCLTFEHRD
jgi:hypothetical protein